MRRVLLVGGILLGFLVGLAVLVAVVLLGSRSPWHATPKKLHPNVRPKTARRYHAPASSVDPAWNSAVPRSIAVAAQTPRPVDAVVRAQ